MLAHASAVKAFNEKKKAGVVKGKIGIKLDGSPAFALNSSDPTHQAVTERAMDFEVSLQERDMQFEENLGDFV